MKLKRLTKFAFVAGLLIAIGDPAQGAEILGIDRPTPDTGPTAKIILVDTATGTGVVVGDTTLLVTSGFDPGNLNTTFGPNGLAYDATTKTAYFVSIPGGGLPSVLYSAIVDPPDPLGLTTMMVGVLSGQATGATFYGGSYWYIPVGSDELHKVDVSFFADTPRGATASARLYSLVETAKANGIEPFAYLKQVFTMLAAADESFDIAELLPWRITLPE